MKLPEDMMIALRGRSRLEENDTTQDEALVDLSPLEIVRQCAGWYLGDPSWAVTFAKWFKAVGIIEEKPCCNGSGEVETWAVTGAFPTGRVVMEPCPDCKPQGNSN